MTTQIAEWIAVDWRASGLRAWVFGQDDQLITTVTSDKGTASLEITELERVLLDLIAPFLGDTKTPVICCGAVGAQQVWQEAAYAKVPCEPMSGKTVLKITATDPRLDIFILAGVSQDNPADYMSGEETQIAGYLAENPKFDGVLCLPDNHTKWVHISAGEIISFRTFMTGEIFSLLSEQSGLRHAVQDQGWDEAEFENTVSDGMSSPQMLSARLFGIKAEGMMKYLPSVTAKSRLSGMLIGIELAGARPYWLGQNIAIIGEPNLSALYASALRVQDVPAQLVNSNQMTLRGLKSAYKGLLNRQLLPFSMQIGHPIKGTRSEFGM